MSQLARACLLGLLVAFASAGSYYAGYVQGARAAPGSAVPASVGTPGPTEALRARFELFWEVWRIVEGEYYDRAALDPERLLYGAIRGMLDALGDPHTAFANPTNARLGEDDMRGSFDGVGIQVEMKDGQLTVVAPLEDTPADRAGIRPGDVVVRVDDADVARLSLLDVVARIRGPRGTPVRLTISRPGAPEPLVFALVRAEIRPVNVRTRLLDGEIGYLKLSSFTVSSGQEVKTALAGLLAAQPRGLVLDLRNNPGGLLHASVDVASQFLRDGVVLYEQRRDAEAVAFEARPGGVATDLPLVVLVNRGSASASEIVAGALQDHRRAILVGEPTFGKDSVQNVHRLSNEASVRVTFARWYTPRRQEIAQSGLTPDLPVPLTEADSQAGRDPQLARALEHLRSQIAAPAGAR